MRSWIKMRLRAPVPRLSNKQLVILKKITQSSTARMDHSSRANIIIMASNGSTNDAISKHLNIHKSVAGKWRHRWIQAHERLTYADARQAGITYQRCILSVLSDNDRAGAPCTFVPEQVCKILNVACEKPDESGLPLSHWSLPSLASELKKRDIVDTISTSQLSRFLNKPEIKPHSVKEWIHTPIENEDEFNATVHNICNLYASASAMHEQNIHVVSTDEKTGMQALDRQITPMQAGQCERRDSSYERHGTQCLIANIEVATGKVIAPSVAATRTENDFAEHIKALVNEAPNDKWIIILDQLNTHKSASLVEFVAKKCALDDELGVKGKDGILKNMGTRATFLTDESHRIRFVYTPKHASWMNQIEVWFSILSRQLLKRLSVKSQRGLKEKVISYVHYYNQALAKPFKWMYQGKQIAA